MKSIGFGTGQPYRWQCGQSDIKIDDNIQCKACVKLKPGSSPYVFACACACVRALDENQCLPAQSPTPPAEDDGDRAVAGGGNPG